MATRQVPSRPVLGIAAAASLLGGPASAGAQATPSRTNAATLARIDSLAGLQARAHLLSGIILVARGDRVLLQRTYGFENWESRVPTSPATRSGIGSITKDMTAILVALLADEGRLDLDAPVTRYLGSFPTGPRGGVVTVRQLLDHRSGVPHRVSTDVEETLPLHPADVVDRVRARGLSFEPGTAELYSSAGYTCLARIIEVIEGKPFDTVLRDRIFRPAAMTGATGETGEELMVHRAMPYRLGPGGVTPAVWSAPYKHLGFLTGAGSVFASAEDLLQFVRAMRKGTFGASGRGQVADSAGLIWRTWYGRINGYEASVDFDPAGDVTFVFLSNLQSAANWQLREQIRSVLVGRTPKPIPQPPAIAASFEAPEIILGAYGDPTDPILITLVDGHLLRDGDDIYPIANGSYYEPVSGSTMRFRRTSDDRVDALITAAPWRDHDSIALRVSRNQ